MFSQGALAGVLAALCVLPASSQITLSEGIAAGAAYTTDFAANVAGGAKRGSS